MGFVPDFKYGQIPTELPDGRVQFRSCYLKEGCDYGILARTYDKRYNGHEFTCTEWVILHLPTRVVVAGPFAKCDQAEEEIVAIMQRKEEELVFDVDTLEARILAEKQLPARWAVLVADLERIYTNS